MHDNTYITFSFLYLLSLSRICSRPEGPAFYNSLRFHELYLTSFADRAQSSLNALLLFIFLVQLLIYRLSALTLEASFLVSKPPPHPVALLPSLACALDLILLQYSAILESAGNTNEEKKSLTTKKWSGVCFS